MHGVSRKVLPGQAAHEAMRPSARLGSPALMLVAALAWVAGCQRQDEVSGRGAHPRPARAPPLILSDVRQDVLDASGPVQSIEARAFVVKPRRLLAFNVRDVNEVLVRDVHWVVHARAEPGHAAGWFAPAAALFGRRGGASGALGDLSLPGRITRVSFEGLSAERHELDGASLSLHAARAVFVPGRRNG